MKLKTVLKNIASNSNDGINQHISIHGYNTDATSDIYVGLLSELPYAVYIQYKESNVRNADVNTMDNEIYISIYPRGGAR